MTTNRNTAERTPAAIIGRLATMQKLTLDAVRCGSEKELNFLILNRTVGVLPYDRASLWHVAGRLRLVGVSGRNDDFAASPAGIAWRRRLEKGLDESPAQIVCGVDGPPEASAIWLPLPVNGKPYAGLLLERFSIPEFSQDDLKPLRPLAQGYGGAFRIFAGRGARPSGKRRWLLASAVVAGLAFLCLWRLPLRIVAPCEVVAARPLPVNAPLDGVIREVRVRPGQEVTEGDILYVYDDAVVRQEMEVASRQVDVTRSNLERAAALARTDLGARAEAVMLQNRLAQDLVRRDAVGERLDKLAVPAPEAGTVIMGDPAEFLGRPVGVGEAVVKIADPGDSLIRIWLPQDDRIRFDPSLPVRVVLNVDSVATLTASLSYVAPHAAPGDDGVYGFMAEAAWRARPPGVNLGLKGTAILYGEKVSLGYWLLRKPIAACRRFFGI